jgi:NAD(P)-dependent dehydrogenase (short-subunit alcohol dehydrogenase family)
MGWTMSNEMILIAGAKGGVAQELSGRLRARGARLALVSRDTSGLDDQQGDVLIQADVATPEGARAAMEQAHAAFGQVPTAVVNACGSILLAPLHRTSEAQYRATLSANLDTAFFLCQAYLGALNTDKRAGNVVLFSSVAARIGIANHAAIAVAKAGVEALVRSIAADASATGTRINAIAPGLMDTPLGARFLASDAQRQQMSAQYPLGRHGHAGDAAALAAWLLSEESSWITGQVIGLDGGFASVRPAVRAAP